jgi:outer membrane protein TolC
MVAVRTLAFLAMHPTAALAQAPPAAPPPAAAATPAPPATAAKPIEVSDAGLAPVPPAPRMLASWKDALTLIDRRSMDLIVAQQEVIRAQAQSRQALGAALPNINASAGVTQPLYPTSTTRTGDVIVGVDVATGNLRTARQTATTSYSASASAALTVSQPILAPRVWYAIGTSKLTVEAAQHSVDDRRRTLLASVASTVVSVVTAERVSEINRVGLRSALERLELTRRRERLGTGTKLDVVRAEQDVALARVKLVSDDESLRKTREALGLALGESDAYGVPETISLNAIEQDMRASCSVAAPDQRADVLAARAELQVSERRVTDAKLALAPTAEVSSRLAVQSEAQPTHVSWSIEATLTIPIWDGGSRYGAIHESRASLEQQRARVDATTRAALLEATQAVRAVNVAEQSRAVAEQARDLARETARLTQVAFESGTATSFDLIESGRRQREAELDLAVREFEVVKAKIAALLASASCR